MTEIVWIFEERTYGELLHLGAFYSLVRFVSHGLEYEEWLSNDDFEIREEHTVEHEE